ncbi:MAG: ATP-binding protein [Candidatus Omnitrophota bacterium]|nr:ATP-binding protein [Candidatus Omnitrophota bacterium]
MDIEVIIKKTIVFASLFIILFGVFVGITLITQELIAEGRIFGLAISALIIIFSVRPLEDLLVRGTDKYLFQKKYDYRQLLRTFSDEVLTVLDLDMLVNLTVNKLVETMKLFNAAMLLHDEKNEEYRIVSSTGLEDVEFKLKDDEEIIVYLRKNRQHILFESEDGQISLSGNIKRKISGLRSSMVIPLFHHKDMVGILSLGKKKSDEEFTQDDFDILLPLARTLSIAIANARLFEKLSVAQAQAAQREKMAVIGTLSAGINHEICNPLGIARGQCEMFLLNLKEGLYAGKDPEDLLEKAKLIMQKVIDETDRATVITRKLSSFAKPAKGKLEGNVRLKKEIEEVASLVEHDLRLDNILIVREIQPDLPYIAADRKQVQEIFFNIIINAAQSIVSGGKITIRAKSDDKKVYVEIEDTGVGIKKTNLNQVFNPFFTTKDPGKGTGLGLFLVKQIVERNKGRISVQSEQGKGACFRLVFKAIVPEKVKI